MDCGAMTRIAIGVEEMAMKHFEEDVEMEMEMENTEDMEELGTDYLDHSRHTQQLYLSNTHDTRSGSTSTLTTSTPTPTAPRPPRASPPTTSTTTTAHSSRRTSTETSARKWVIPRFDADRRFAV